MSSSNVTAQRARAKTDPEPSLPSLDIHVPKRRKTITAMDSTDHEKRTNDQYHVEVELAEVPVTTLFEPPPLISDYTHITSSFLNHAISYAKFRLPRNITPRIASLLREYLDLAEKVQAKQDLVDKVCLYQCHKTLHSEAFLSRKPSKDELEQRAAMRELCILRYYLQYGDYVADQCTDFRHKAARLEGENLSFLWDKTPWTEVQAMIDRENEARSQWQANGEKGPIPRVPTQDAIFKACVQDHFHYHQMLYSIRWYAQRNSRAHNGVGRMIKDCSFEELGNRLFLDLHAIPTIFGADDQGQMKAVVERFAKRYFFKVEINGSVKNDYAIRLTTKRDNALLAQAKKAEQIKESKGKSTKSTLTIGQQRRAVQDDQRESVHEERTVTPSTDWLDGANEDMGMGTLE